MDHKKDGKFNNCYFRGPFLERLTTELLKADQD